MDSCLLLKAENEAVKMHDLVREVALWIGNKLVQVAVDSTTPLMENIQYSSWNINDFPSNFDGRKLEVLLLWISNNTDSSIVKVPDGIFEGMDNLKFLALMNESHIRISGASLFQSLPSLINVRTLAIKGFKLGDISILVNLKGLESLELSNCSMIELPKEIRQLEKLRLLEIVNCHIERNSSFEVIGSCLQLEELYFVSNHMDEDTSESPSQITTFPKLERYKIKAWLRFGNYKVDFSICGYFDSNNLRVNFSNEIFKSLVARAEVLKLDGDYCNRAWTNVVPDILPVKDDSMEDQLTRLCLQSMKGIECLIRTEGLPFDMAIFSKLVELQLSDMDVRELCYGPYPINFLKQLEKLHLSGCRNLEGSLFDGKLELCNLKSVHLHECSMTCLFHPFTAQSLKQLEMLRIEECSELKYIVVKPMEDHDPNQRSHDSMFPKLKYLKVKSCPELEFILPTCLCKDLPLLKSMNVRQCEKLKYILGQYPEERDLHQMGKEVILQFLEELEIVEVPNFINMYAERYLPSDEERKSSPSKKVEDDSSSLSRSPLCWFWPKSNASTMCDSSSSMNHNQALKKNYVVNRAHGLFTPQLYPYTRLRRMEISQLVGLKSLFTLSIASSLKLLEILTVRFCDTLEHIVTDKEDDHDHINVNSIFPNLQEVEVLYCSLLEYIFPAFYSKDFRYLECVSISEAEKLTHVFGKCEADQNHNVQDDFNLPALKRLYLDSTPNMVSICAENYSMKALYLEDIRLEICPQFALKTLIDLPVVGHKRQEDLSRRKVKKISCCHYLFRRKALPQELSDPKSYTSFQNLSELRTRGCKQLKFILSASTSRMLQKLKKLAVSECEELVSIIDEDEESNENSMAPHQVYFPELRTIEVRDCKSMKYLFSIPSGKLPRLFCVELEDTPQLGEVFRRKHGEGQELVMKDVFPKLYMIRLVNLPALHTIYQGIDFHTVVLRHVRRCPAISLTSANASYEELIKLSHSLGRDSVDDVQDFHNVQSKIWKWLGREHWNAMEQGHIEHKQNRISPNLSEIEGEGSQQDIENDSTTPQQNNGSPHFAKSKVILKEIAEEDSTTNSNSLNLTESTKTSANEIVEEEFCTPPSSNSNMNLKATFGEGPSTEKYDKASSSPYSKPNIEKPYALAPSKELRGKELMGDQQALKEPTHQCSSKETSNEMAIARISPQISLICSPKKPQIKTSAAWVELGNSTITDQSVHDNLVHKASSSTPSELTISKQGTSASAKELSEKESKGDQEALVESINRIEGLQRVKEPTIDLFTKETTNKVVLEISTTNTEMTSPVDSSISTPKKSQVATSTTPTEPKRSQSGLLDISITTECPQVEIMTNDETCTDEEEMKFAQKSLSQIFEEHDLMRLFQMTKEVAAMEVDLSYVSKLITDLQDNKEVTKAFADLEALMKMGLNEIACSEERRLRLHNALNTLSSHCSEEGASSHGLQDTIQSLQQEIQTTLSSFNQAYAAIATFTKLEQKEKLMIEQRSEREKDAKTLIYNINNTKNSIDEAQLNEAELKEQISRLQADLHRKEKEIEEYERKLLSLQEQEKKSVSDTIGFTMEFLAMEKESSRMVEYQMKARQQLENMDAKWSSCSSNLKKTTMLLGVHLKQKLG